MFDIKIDLEGERQLNRRLRIVSSGVKNLYPAMKTTGQLLQDLFEGAVFQTKGAVIGEPWAKRKYSYPWPILEKTGKMRRGFKYKASSMKAEIYNTVEYFKYHQSILPRRKLPRRVMMKVDVKRRDAIVQIFRKEINKLLKK